MYTYECAVAKAEVIKTSLATSKIRLFKFGLVVNAALTRAQLLAAECDFDGYTAGGYAVAAFAGPTRGEAGGAKLTGPLLQPTYGPAGTPPVGNDVGGYWLDDATAVTPKVRLVAVYSPKRTIAIEGDAIQLVTQIVEGLNAPVEAP